jgi:hypothetical protein
MTARPRKEVPKIRTRTGMAHEASKPHNNFITLASLELKRTMCEMVRTAARGRVAEMDRQLAEIDQEQAELLSAIEARRESGLVGPHAPPAGDAADEPAPARFTLKYGGAPDVGPTS